MFNNYHYFNTDTTPPVEIGQFLVSHGVVDVRHLVVGPDKGIVAHCRTLLYAVVLPVEEVPRRRNPVEVFM